MTTDFQFPMFAKLEPRTQWKGGRITSTDVLTLDAAAKYASKHADAEITPDDFLRAAARGEITLRAIVHRESKLEKFDGGIYCNEGTPTENTIPLGAIATLPLSACQQLANAGRASWRTLDGFEQRDGELLRFTVATLTGNEPDLETVPTDCRVMGDAVHALADEYLDVPAALSGAHEKAETPPPVVTPAFRPKIGWQVVLFDSWLNICRTHARIPTAPEAARWLKNNDDTGIILDKPAGHGFWWQPQRGKAKEVDVKTIENVISDWKAKGVLPA